MIKFIIRRLIISLPQVILLSILVFFIGSLMPGDALSGLIDPTIPVEQIERLREQMGLNDPWYIQYKDWVVAMLQGDFGHSFFKQQPVLDVIGDRMLNTVWLGLFSTVLIYLIGLPLGLISGRWNDSLLDSAITGYTYLGFATPTFIFGLVMLLVFGYTLVWLPTGGSVGVGVTPGTVEYLRSGIIETKQKDFVTLARAKGVSEGKVYTKHIFRNSILPIAAFFGYEITSLLGGSLFIETIYGYPGMGRLFLESISIRD